MIESAKLPAKSAIEAFPLYAPAPHPYGLSEQAVNPPQSAEFSLVNIEAAVVYSDKAKYWEAP